MVKLAIFFRNVKYKMPVLDFSSFIHSLNYLLSKTTMCLALMVCKKQQTNEEENYQIVKGVTLRT
jgi:hypothetical protein